MAESAAPFVECEQVHAGLAVNDIATAVEFYTKKLGFAAAFTWGDPPTFAGVKLDKAQIFLRKGTPDAFHNFDALGAVKFVQCVCISNHERDKAIKAVDQFSQADGRECRFLVACRFHDLFDQLLDGVAAPFGSDHHAGIEDQSHAGGFNGSRWLLIAASRSRAKSLSSVAVEACSLPRCQETSVPNPR
jgi:catechol 2,3-dioxygenase-like lactoylglutathione lyase family enzyme